MIDVIIPTYKPGGEFVKLIEKLKAQSSKVNKVIIVNTEQKYFESFAMEAGELLENDFIEVHHIEKSEFDHGATRNRGVGFSDAEIFVMMTQDAIPVDEFFIENLIKPLNIKGVAASYARQVANPKSSYIERITREFNYPDISGIKSKKDLDRLGIKTYFCSNVSCAYSRAVFDKLGGFINHTIFNEDMIYAAAMINNGYKIAYTAEAEVYHSHDYTGLQQFKRNVDIGVSQADNPEIFNVLSSEKEGKRMIKLVITRLFKEKQGLKILPYIYVNACKYMGYIIGKNYRKLPGGFVRLCSSNPEYFS